MKKTLFSGVCTALVTPFLGEALNLPMLRIMIQKQESAGISAVLLFGTTGESATLSDEEKHQIMIEARAQTKMLLIAGTGSNSTSHAITLSRQAEEDGADALLLVSPYYNKATEQGLIQHYKLIAESVSIPIILYNVPSRTGLDIPVSVYRALSQVPNIIGVKETTANLTKLTAIARECPPDFYVWCGSDELTVPYLSMGAKGSISVLSNVLPEDTEEMIKAGLDGDFDTAFHLQASLQPIIEYLFCEVNPIPVKALLKRFGLDCGGCRLPLSGLSTEGQRKLDEILS